jgi:hypothetical protein
VIRRRVTAILLSASLFACGDSTAPRTVTGSWTGTTIASASLFQIDGELLDTGGTITGTGSVIGAGIDCPPNITGTRSGSTVDLTFSCIGYMPFVFSASLSKDGRTLTGNLSGSGFDGTSLSLSKQN